MLQRSTRVCILGGGFGGLYTALRLSEFSWEGREKPEIVLIDRQDRFLFMPLLYELVTGEMQTWEIAPPYVELLADTGVRFMQAEVSQINLETQEVTLDSGQVLQGDRIVLALGGETPLSWVPGCQEYAIPFRTLEDVYRLEESLRSSIASEKEVIRVAIAGAGYSGVELACKLADRLGDRGRIRLVEKGDCILANSPEFNRQAAETALKQKGVWIDLETTIEAIAPDSISLYYKGQEDTIPVDLVLWTVGTQIPPSIQALDLKKNPRGQITTTPTLQAIDRPHYFILGDLSDSCDATGQVLPKTAQAAIQQADYCAWNVWASLCDRPLLPVRYSHLGEMMALGIDNATLTGLGLQLDGPLAHIARRLVYLYRLPTLNHQLKVAFNWLTQPLQEIMLD
ncbi:NAD(P)/FAD-dependent oxidoreductase [Roseofilum sp. BLCC_M91]|uniref:NAD(P)/FAD-dependent oxidoreductase n=1 Tax=Roseofilum halophilum BLCC-M91 TaxID=3022259 RepID=A0ABT7BMX3_9CYAN|nr:NAD(P)/FAD-dependent oxidoreductase [Roseofilum halophilum]MDJ1180549.1 NAD(P)/FAD-dependent oxidoreductase [Roseofilum halophilum BLCC-M91]